MPCKDIPRGPNMYLFVFSMVHTVAFSRSRPCFPSYSRSHSLLDCHWSEKSSSSYWVAGKQAPPHSCNTIGLAFCGVASSSAWWTWPTECGKLPRRGGIYFVKFITLHYIINFVIVFDNIRKV